MVEAATANSMRSIMAYRGRDRRRAVAMDVLDRVQSVQQLGAVGAFSQASIHSMLVGSSGLPLTCMPAVQRN